MKAAALIDVLAALDCKLEVADGKLRIEGSAPPPEPLLALVQTHKQALIEHLRPPAMWTPADWRDFHNERAAIMEYDAGFSREHAEEEALQECFRLFAGRRATPRMTPGMTPG